VAGLSRRRDGAGLMLLPVYLAICAAGEQDAGHHAGAALMNLRTTIAISIVHATAMIVRGGVVAFPRMNG